MDKERREFYDLAVENDDLDADDAGFMLGYEEDSD